MCVCAWGVYIYSDICYDQYKIQFQFKNDISIIPLSPITVLWTAISHIYYNSLFRVFTTYQLCWTDALLVKHYTGNICKYNSL